VSYREHPGFHEATVEQIYLDIQNRLEPTSLTVYGRFLRRGGVDINPFRSSNPGPAPELRVARQ
jgi:7-cyano-7-deazaguanine reductase